MKKLIPFTHLLNCLILLLMISCNEEQRTQNRTNDFAISTEMLRLTNDSTAIAGTIEIQADVSVVDLEWVTLPECKLNTRLSKLHLENGKAVIPVEWLKPFENKNFHLSGTSFAAGVKITAGDETKYVSLLWGKDKDNVLEEPVSRVPIEPRVASITFDPQRVVLNSQTGGAALVTLNNVATAVVDYSSITSSMNINLSDKTLLPLVFEASRSLVFTWIGNAPSTSFTTNVLVYGSGVPAATLELVYDASGGGEDTQTLTYVNSNLPTGNIPVQGDTYEFEFTGTYTGGVQVRAIVDGIEQDPGLSVTDKKPQCLVSANTLTTTRDIKFEYKRADGDWMALPVSTNRIQSAENGGGAETLTFITSTLPTGNIPQSGGTYSFTFEGTYQGRLQARAIIEGTTYLGGIVNAGNLNPTVVVPANLTTAVRPVRFQYRALDATDAVLKQWTNFPEGGITKKQDANTTTSVIPGPLTPAGNIGEYGRVYSCIFTGNFTGNIIVRATVTTPEEAVLHSGEGTVGKSISVTIPQLFGLNRVVRFEYSIDGGNSWILLENRNQINETLSFSQLKPFGDIPVGGGTYTITISGTYSKTVTVMAKDRYGRIIVKETSKVNPSHEFKLVVPRNDSGSPLAVGFSFLREGETKEEVINVKVQNYK